MRLIDADELLKLIPPEETCRRFAVENAPTVEPQQWIPCSERLPDSCGWYICSIKDGRVNALYYANQLGWIDNVRKYMFELYDIRSKLTGTEVTPDQEAVDWNDWVMAWMPLPTPYREEGDQE